MFALRKPTGFWIRSAVILMIFSLLLASPASQANAGDIGERAMPRSAPQIAVEEVVEFPADSYPSSLLYGPAGKFWLTLLGANQIASFTPPDTIDSENTPTEDARLFDLTIGPQKDLWFTEQEGNRIGRYRYQDGFEEYPLSTPLAAPTQIVLGQNGSLWFTEFEGNKIGRITPTGEIYEYPLPNANSKPLGIASDLAGNLWFTEWNGYRIGKLTLQGVLSEYPLPNNILRPTEIVLGPDGNMWFVYEIGKKITRLDPSTGEMTTYTLNDTQSNALTDLAIGPDGKLWYLGVESVGWLEIGADGPSNLEETPIPAMFEGEGRPQIIAGPGAEMHFITNNSQKVYRASAEPGQLVDLQVFVTELPPLILAAGEFYFQADLINWSNTAATGVEIEIPLDEGVDFVGIDQPSATCSQDDALVTCQLPDIPAQGLLAVYLTFTASRVEGGQVERSFDFTVHSAEGDYKPADNRIYHPVTIATSIDYFTDFSSGSDEFWSHASIANPGGSDAYLGFFDNEQVKLEFLDLPPHDRIRLCFDLYIAGAWDGSGVLDTRTRDFPPAAVGPDLWSLYLNDDPLLLTTFSNQPFFRQAYPHPYPQEETLAQDSARSLGEYDGDTTTTDARYHICHVRLHTPRDFIATFYGLNLEPSDAEKWALDNVALSIYYAAVYDYIYIPMIQR